MPRPRRWLAAGGLLMVTGALTAVSTWRHWALCRSDSASLACEALQDATHGFPGWGGTQQPDPLAFATATLAAVLLGAAWLSVVGWSRSSVTRRILCGVVGLQPLVVAVLLTAEWTGHSAPAAVGRWLTWPAEAYVFPLLLGAGWLLNETARATVRLLVLGWGVTSFGSLHQFGDYVITQLFSPGAPGTSPPGMGYATATTQLILGLLVIALTVDEGSTDAPDPDDGPGGDAYTLAA